MFKLFLAFLFLSTQALAGNATYIKGPTLIESVTTTATAAGTTTLTVSSNTNQQFTGTSTQNVVLPDATTLAVGRRFTIMNRSTGALTLKDNGANTLATIAAGLQIEVLLIANGTSNGTWDYNTGVLNVASGGTGASTLTSNNVLLGNGTSAVQFVAPSTSGNVLQSNGTTWVSASPASASYTAPTFQKFTTTGARTGTYFFVTAANATAGATYTNNGQTFTVVYTISGGTILITTQTGDPTASGTLTKATGTGDATITFSSGIALATYTTPVSPTPIYLKVKVLGSGAGGGSHTGTGSSGTRSTFGGDLYGGGGNNGNYDIAGTGGTYSLGALTAGFGVNGGGGQPGGNNGATASPGGVGGSSILGGAGKGGRISENGGNAAANSGSGGGGQDSASTVGYSGGGGGAGGYVEAIISSPAATYLYSVGPKGTGASNAGDGGDGLVIVEEHYQ